ncbi:MAG: hypothetical protein M3Z25_22690 [Actinomycetota bacterium]|nr:hypothetical protein [Actinomycetota bacterium]
MVDKGLRQVTWPAIDLHRDYITDQLAAQVTVSTIHQRLVHEHGLNASVASLRRWVGGNLPEEARRARVRVLRPGTVKPGSEAQIDHGRLGMWTDPDTGRRGASRGYAAPGTTDVTSIPPASAPVRVRYRNRQNPRRRTALDTPVR